MTTPTVRHCQVCGEPFERRKGERRNNFLARKTCMRRECWLALLRRPKPPVPYPSRPCTVCGEPIPKRGLARSQYERVKTCGRPECAAESRARTSRATKARIRAELVAPKECEFCGDTFTIRDGERVDQYRRRKTCSAYCACKLSGANRSKATFDSARRRALRLLREYDGIPLTFADMKEELRVGDDSLRAGLRVLTGLGLVEELPERDEQGRKLYRAVVAEHARVA